jgi:hypothetical protein
MKKIMLWILTAALVLSAAFVPVDRAKKVAENQYMQYCADASTKSANVVNVVENVYEGEVTWYAFEFDNGFVIVSADDAVRPILGYSDHGKIVDLNRKGGENFKEWFGYYDKQIALARKNNFVDETGRKSWKDIEANVFSSSKAGVIVDKLLQSEWDQIWPWNDQTPVIGTDTTPVGCVATAMAQITKYHRWPLTGTGTVRYRPYAGAATTTVNFADYTFDYDLMPEILVMEYGLYPTYWENLNFGQPEIDQLASHSLAMGYSAKMNYAVDGSGAMMSDSRTAMVNNWYCSGTTALQNFATPTLGGTDASYNTIKTQLDAKRPWLWAGGVHAFVLDGYRDDYWYHFNWGWGGAYDGWFHRSALIPDGALTGGGDGDYTSGQQGFCIVPNTNPYTAWPATTVSGSVSGGENITVNWTAQTGATEYKVFKTVDKNNPVMVTTTTGTTYSENSLPAGNYSYHVIVVYSTGESHISNSYSATLAPVGFDYPIARSLSAKATGRTSIDLNWIEPFIGVMNTYIDFEGSTVIPSGWLVKLSAATGGLIDDTNNYVRILKPENYQNWKYADRCDGNVLTMAASVINTTQHTEWFLSPSITFNSGHTIKWWNRFRYSDDTGAQIPQRPRFQIVSYPGNFSDQNYTELAIYDGANGAPENIWEYEESVSLASLNGQTSRVGIRVAYNSNDLYTPAFDNIVIGSEQGGGDNPSGFKVYREGVEVANITNGTTKTWSDTGFADGSNTYFVRAIYPTGSSMPSNYATATIVANPKPDYLSGVGGTSAQLSWFMPNHHAPKWHSHLDPYNGTSTTELDDTNVRRKRTIYKAEDIGVFYPITLDSIGAVFYDMDELNWGGINKFKFRILVGDPLDPASIVYESAELTAVHNQKSVQAIDPPMVLNEPFNVEVYNSVDSDFPANLMGAAEGGTHSYFEYDPGTGVSYTYGITFGTGEWAEWALMAHLTSSEPSKNDGWVSPVSTETDAIPYLVEKPKLIKTPYKGKGLDYYKIYRDDVAIGTSTTLSYTDSSVPVTGDYTYKVTAAYVSPVGESLPSNEIVLNVEATGGTLDAPANVVTALVGSDIRVSWDASTGATSYDVYTSADPYGTFTFEGNTANTYYDYTPGTTAKMFFYIKAKN